MSKATTIQPLLPEIRKPLSRVRSAVIKSEEESMTDTSFGNECDINQVIARCQRTGTIPEPTQTPQYADVTGLQKDLTQSIEDSKNAMAVLEAAQRQEHKEQKARDKERLEKYDQLEQQVKEMQANQGLAENIDKPE